MRLSRLIGWSGTAALGVVCAGLGVTGGNPTLLLLGLVLSCGAALPRRVPSDLRIPLSALLLLALAVVVTAAAAVAGIDLLSRPRATAVSLLALVTSVGVLAVSRPGRVDAPGSFRPRWLHAAQVPAMAAVGIALLQSASTRAAASWSFYGTDLAEHLRLLKGVQDVGGLDYAQHFYPRALHALVALTSAAGLPGEPQALLAHDLRTYAAVVWLALALVLTTAVALTRRLATAAGCGHRRTFAACSLVGALLLTSNAFLEMFVFLGGAPGLIAYVAMWAVPLAVLERSAWWVIGGVGFIAALVLAQLWQPLCVVPASGLLAHALPLLRDRRVWLALRTSRRLVVALCPLVIVAVVAALLPVMAVVRAGGLQLAAIPGISPRVPYELLIVTGMSVAGCALLARGSLPRALVGSSLGAAGVVVLALIGADDGVTLTNWYPNKALWFLVVLLIPLVSLAAVVLPPAGWRVLRRATVRLGGAARVSRIAVLGVVFALGFAFWLPGKRLPGVGAWLVVRDADRTTESARRFAVARDYGLRYAPALTVPVFVERDLFREGNGAYVVSKLIAFQSGQTANFGKPAGACADLEVVPDGADAVVVTTLPEDVFRDLVAEQGCTVDRVVTIPGLSPETARLLRGQRTARP